MSRIDMEDILDRYLKGEALPEEIERVEAWLDKHHNPDAGWQRMDKAGREQWLNVLFEDIKADIDDEPEVVQLRPHRQLWRTLGAVAAVAAIFLAVYFSWPSLKGHQQPVQLTTLIVKAGEKKQVILADGSKIWINSLSQLRYPKAFNGSTREVYLLGEAYFDIKHDAAKPFIIHTGKVLTTVLGTAFNIKENCKEHTVTVTVSRGKVSVANGSQALGVITPNQQISFNTVSHQHMQTDVDADKVIAWQLRDIHFDDITFADAAEQLHQRFKVNIGFANEKVKNCRFTGTALKEEDLDKILKVICTFNNATYSIKTDGSIMIDGPGCE